MTNLADFLLARIAEDERHARAAADRVPLIYDDAVLRDKGIGIAQASHIPRWSPNRVLAECDAKRRIVKLATSPDGDVSRKWSSLLAGAADSVGYVVAMRDQGEVVLRLLALPYAGHPDYDTTWRP